MINNKERPAQNKSSWKWNGSTFYQLWFLLISWPSATRGCFCTVHNGGTSRLSLVFSKFSAFIITLRVSL